MDKKAFGSRLRQARKDRGLTSEKLSELCNINATYLRQIEGGTKVPSLPIFISLCEALDASPNSLLIDSLPAIGLETINELAALWKAATPSQIKVVTAMLTSALRVLQESQTETT